MTAAVRRRPVRQRTRSPLTTLLADIRDADATLFRDRDRVFLGDDAPADLKDRLEAQSAAVCAAVTPAVDPTDRVTVRGLLDGYNVVFVADDRTARRAVDRLAAAHVLAIDTETAVLPEFRAPVPIAINKDGTIAKRQPKDGAAGYALDPRRARVRLLQVHAGADEIVLFDMAAVSWGAVAPLFDRDVVMFNAVFDIKMILASGGPEPGSRVFDTMTAMRLLGPCEQWPLSMAAAADQLLDITVPKGLGASDWSGELTRDQTEYAAVDAVVTYRLWEAQRAEFDTTDENAQAIADACLVAVARMELAGMPVDVSAHREFIGQWTEELAAADHALETATAGRLRGVPTDNEVRAYLEVVLTDEQLETWPRTGKTGALAANATAFKDHGAGVPAIPELLAVKAWTKGLSTYGEGLLALVDDGRFYSRFLVCGASTGRFSSRDPNLQNVPKRSKLFASFRRVFRAPAGYRIMAADYSQIELREMAEQSGDETMLGAFAASEDVHLAMARKLAPDFDELGDADKKRARSAAKAANFGLIYGSGPKGFATYARVAFGLSMSEDEAADVIATWRVTYPGIVAWQEQQRWQTKRDGYVSTAGGRRWWWEWRAREWDDPRLDELEDWQVDDAVSGFSYTYACNHPIQGTCAEVMQVALAYIDRRLRAYDARLVATVHDEVVLVVRDDPATLKAVKRVLRCTMTRAWLEFHPGAPRRGLVDIRDAETWAEAH